MQRKKAAGGAPPELAATCRASLRADRQCLQRRTVPEIDDDRKAKTNPLNDNFQKKEFQDLWNRINRKAAYTVQFESAELVTKCVKASTRSYTSARYKYTIQRGEQTDDIDYDQLKQGEAFKVTETSTESLKSIDPLRREVRPDRKTRGGDSAHPRHRRQRSSVASTSPSSASTRQTRRTSSPKAARLINEQKATVIVEHLAYDPIDETHEQRHLHRRKSPRKISARHSRPNATFTTTSSRTSKNERTFVEELDTSTEVVVYAKLPEASSFRRQSATTTPIGPLPSKTARSSTSTSSPRPRAPCPRWSCGRSKSARSSVPGSSSRRSPRTRSSTTWSTATES